MGRARRQPGQRDRVQRGRVDHVPVPRRGEPGGRAWREEGGRGGGPEGGAGEVGEEGQEGDEWGVVGGEAVVG